MAGDAIEAFHVFTSHINVFGETSTQVAFNGFAVFCFFPLLLLSWLSKYPIPWVNFSNSQIIRIEIFDPTYYLYRILSYFF